VKKLGLMAVAAIAYGVAAWMVAPGFYDGFGPPQPYNFTCPPPQAGSNNKPLPGHADISVRGGVSDASSAYTQDGQIVVGFLPGAFVAGARTAITVDIKPLDTCPQPPGLRFVTNVYQVTASAPLNSDKPANVEIRYSNLEPDPSVVYQAQDPNGPWTSQPKSQPGMPYTIVTTTTTFGYFAAGNPAPAPAPGSVTVGGGPVLPIIVAVLIVVVVLAGLPLAVARRRRSSRADD
jgi:hypothetical protein